jgi:hypothetical protein
VIPFSTRFNHVSKFERDVYSLTLVSAGLAALLIIAPVAHHRIVFRKHEKAALVRRGHQFASAALLLLSLTLLGVFALVTNFLFGTALTICTSAVYLLAVSTLLTPGAQKCATSMNRKVRHCGGDRAGFQARRC